MEKHLQNGAFLFNGVINLIKKDTYSQSRITV